MNLSFVFMWRAQAELDKARLVTNPTPYLLWLRHALSLWEVTVVVSPALCCSSSWSDLVIVAHLVSRPDWDLPKQKRKTKKEKQKRWHAKKDWDKRRINGSHLFFPPGMCHFSLLKKMGGKSQDWPWKWEMFVHIESIKVSPFSFTNSCSKGPKKKKEKKKKT